MRLWSLHPRYLDPAGLVALWREALLAQAVLAGKTRGYKSHPQLDRFLEQRNPCGAIARYLHVIADEAERRGYAFDRAKIATRPARLSIALPRGQLRFELTHLKRKVRRRNARWYATLRSVQEAVPHPGFTVVAGGVAGWERI